MHDQRHVRSDFERHKSDFNNLIMTFKYVLSPYIMWKTKNMQLAFLECQVIVTIDTEKWFTRKICIIERRFMDILQEREKTMSTSVVHHPTLKLVFIVSD